MMFTVRVDQSDPRFAKMLLEQFGGPNGELAAAMRYFTQGWAEPDVKRRDMLLEIATEELSHLEMVGQTLVQLLRGTPGAEIDAVESGYLGKLLDGKHESFIEAAARDCSNRRHRNAPCDLSAFRAHPEPLLRCTATSSAAGSCAFPIARCCSHSELPVLLIL
jgi:Manganese containing catalase